MPKVSIITPVYNAEKTIYRCLDSIVSQTLSDWECILINDGSSDSSGHICDMYANNDSRFRVIHKENAGVAMARKDGMDASIGDYIIHVDPDDYVEHIMLEDMYGQITRTKVDILVVDYFVNFPNGTQQLRKQEFKGTKIEELSSDILLQKLHGSLCNKMMKSTCYRDFKPVFFPGVDYCEDVLIWLQLSKCQLEVGYYPKAYYHYVINQGSITNNSSHMNLLYKKLFISKLEELNVDKQIVNDKAFSIKVYAVSAGLMERGEYYSYYPTKIETVRRAPNIQFKIFGFLAFFQMFYLAKLFIHSYLYLARLSHRLIYSA